MEIFGIGIGEMLIIAVVALVILGPDRLPEAFRTAGRTVGEFRRALEPARSAWADVQREINSATQLATPASGNPWTVHPLAEGLNDEEKERFFTTGELPEWRLTELSAKNPSLNGAGASREDLPPLEYPMPHTAGSDRLASGEPLEELFYPEPFSKKEEGKEG